MVSKFFAYLPIFECCAISYIKIHLLDFLIQNYLEKIIHSSSSFYRLGNYIIYFYLLN